MAELKILHLGDIVGKPGRRAVAAVLPELKEKYQPDLIIAQAENIAHGYGVTERTLRELMDAGVEFFTGGNHVFKNPNNIGETFKNFPIIRPANFADPQTIGTGHELIGVGVHKVLIINLMGQVYFKQDLTNPFTGLDEILKQYDKDTLSAIIVDFHAEATSEKRSLGHHADGRVSLVVGTHTHVQTADEQILPLGTAYITDLGMSGIKHSSLGMDFENIVQNFINGTTLPKTIPDHGYCIISGIFAKINTETSLASHIERVSVEAEV